MRSDLRSATSQQRSARAGVSGEQTSARPAARRRISSHAEFRVVLRRAGYSTTQAQLVLRGLPDPIDFDRDGQALFEHGVSLERLVSAMGGSP